MGDGRDDDPLSVWVRSHRTDALSPERRLLFEILLQARREFSSPRLNKQSRDALIDWIESSDDTWIFSFESICDALGLSPAMLRKIFYATEKRAQRGRRINS